MRHSWKPTKDGAFNATCKRCGAKRKRISRKALTGPKRKVDAVAYFSKDDPTHQRNHLPYCVSE